MRMTRAQQQERTKGAVLSAAKWEFSHFGYAGAKVDRIAERAELTRGAVYSNFPSKRSLYLAVLLAAAASPMPDPPGELAGVASAVEAFARVWLERLPLATDEADAGRLAARSLTGVVDDDQGRAALAQITRVEGLLLGLALESCRARGSGRQVRLAELLLTMLQGAAHLAETAPGFGDPFDVARACRHLAGLPLADEWDPPHLPFVASARPVHFTPAGFAELLGGGAGGFVDLLSGRLVGFGDDGVLVVLGSGRLEAAEEAVRAARPGDTVTLAFVTDDPAETGALVRLRLTDLTTCLRRVFGHAIRPEVRVVLDDHGALATAIGLTAAADTESAVRVRTGEIVARADGRGAGHAAASS
ncbi:TetR/AcrR family transcriptional regulator [Paractinoplanes lichenicola]|uniref:Helix-turn-helix transcriptional regulator n=1 Tax=Paractinoplanes lichenicola TaxID=2802976 RepID=A0ABS1VMJ7_9ACTN|nr:TetR/AcrR family transcriptional regulator [Actinoplanes lichenicola]MBL7255711.1 helix-turn-helix transcriptional regulator [Actinoplanes lichenicola]